MERAEEYEEWLARAPRARRAARRDRVAGRPAQHAVQLGVRAEPHRALRRARRDDDWRGAVAAAPAVLGANVGGIMAPQLFSMTHTGEPKRVVTAFADEVSHTVRWLTAKAIDAADNAAAADGGDGGDGGGAAEAREAEELFATTRTLYGAARESYGRTASRSAAARRSAHTTLAS